MNRINCFVALGILFFYSCQSDGRNFRLADKHGPDKSVVAEAQSIDSEGEFLGLWRGPFRPATESRESAAPVEDGLQIAITIELMRGGVVEGYSFVEGNERPFQGSYTLGNGIYSFVAKEPGSTDHDGVFRFKAIQGDSILTGTWAPFKKEVMPVMAFELRRHSGAK